MAKTPRRRAFILAVLTVAFFVALYGAYTAYSERRFIRDALLADTALTEEIVEAGNSQTITFKELYDKADENVNSRGRLIRRLRTYTPRFYRRAVADSIGLLSAENEFARATKLEISLRVEFMTAGETREEADREFMQAYEDYKSSPDYYSASQFRQAGREYRAASQAADEAMSECNNAARDRASAAQRCYSLEKKLRRTISRFAPSRRIRWSDVGART